MERVKVKIISKSGRRPEYKTDGAAGMDLRAYLDGPVTIAPMERRLIPTGIFAEIPEGYEAQVRARSGLAMKHGIGLVNGIGTIDSDYRGEIGVLLINMGNEDFVINDGDRIAQLVITSYARADVELVEEIGDTQRGEGGFGHTGV